jgi:CheY-like chemotaxis protein/AraC-like DNA-binding protein
MELNETKPRILIVDDNPNIHRDFELVFDADFKNHDLDAEEKNLFGASGGSANQGAYELDHAFSGIEGVEKVSQSLTASRQYQMAFVDIRMPGIDGMETIARIWKIDPAIQIVICTAFADYSQEDLTARLGRTDKLLVLKKPFDTIEVTQLAGTLTAKWFLAQRAALKMEQMELLVARRTERVLDLQRREAQRIHDLDQMKLQFLNNFVNEFRTPLTLLAASVEQMLGVEKLQPQEQEMLRRHAGRLLHLVNHLADHHTVEAQELKLEISPADLVILLRGIIRIFQPVASQQKVDLQFQTDEDSIPASFDSGKMEKVLFLILSNTLQTMPDGGRIAVRADSSRASLTINIENPGGNIPSPSENQPVLWLALARHLMEIQHGKLLLEILAGTESSPVPATGYRFTLNLPLGKTNIQGPRTAPVAKLEPEVSPVANLEETSTGNDDLPVLLIIETDQELRQHIRQSFETEYRVTEAAGDRDGFKTAKEIMPDLIIAGSILPPMDGVELCSLLKSDDLTSHIPVILLAAHGDEQRQLKALEAGVDEFIIKPFRLPLLKARAGNLLESRRRLRERFAPPARLIPCETAANQMDLQFIRRVSLIVEKNLSDFEFNVDTLAREISVSRQQLFRKIKAVTNNTPNMLIRTMRLHRAAQLLKESRLTVSEITYAVGFADLKHFREVFQEQFGVLPGDYAEHSADKPIERL